MPKNSMSLYDDGSRLRAKDYEMCVDLTCEEVIVLETLCRRFSWMTAKSLSIDFDGGRERDLMIEVVIKLWRAVPKLDA